MRLLQTTNTKDDVSISLVIIGALMRELDELGRYMMPSPCQVKKARVLSIAIAHESLKVNEFYKKYGNLERL